MRERKRKEKREVQYKEGNRSKMEKEKRKRIRKNEIFICCVGPRGPLSMHGKGTITAKKRILHKRK